jgi:hypothetical protein
MGPLWLSSLTPHLHSPLRFSEMFLKSQSSVISAE